jgi:hypothetical protein
MNSPAFIKIDLPFQDNLFHELSNQVHFENVGKGRWGNQLVRPNEDGVPIVRTTTPYSIPAHHFSTLHDDIIKCINDQAKHLPALDFNNGLIEIYDESYSKMKYHSDQCLDLAENSFIGLFSCYENPNALEADAGRILKIKNKTTEEVFEISLTHHSCVLFSVDTNAKYAHKIILDVSRHQQKHPRWLGITFRTSKTFVQFKNSRPYLFNGDILQMADENQKKTFYKLRGEENKSLDFSYPALNFTINPADLIPPVF